MARRTVLTHSKAAAHIWGARISIALNTLFHLRANICIPQHLEQRQSVSARRRCARHPPSAIFFSGTSHFTLMFFNFVVSDKTAQEGRRRRQQKDKATINNPILIFSSLTKARSILHPQKRKQGIFFY